MAAEKQSRTDKLAEQETIIRYDKSSDVATIYTANKADITKFSKRCKLISKDKFGATFEIDKKQISIRAKRVSKTTAQKEN